MTQTEIIAGKARTLGLSEGAVRSVVLWPDPGAALETASQVVALCKLLDRPELVDSYVTDLQACRERICGDRARADELLHIDTTPPVKHKGVWDEYR